jgi:hypothetical protein
VGILPTLGAGERHRFGSRGLTITRLAGLREITQSRIIRRHLSSRSTIPASSAAQT